ncbi:hypothetical protein OIU76_028838 [Salix suchowensis]|nr:hypothetical protein OIU76_028838 [Salix suchowensis]
MTPPVPSLLVNDTAHILPTSHTNPTQPSHSKTSSPQPEPPVIQTVTQKNLTAPIAKVPTPQITLANKIVPEKTPPIVTEVVKTGKEPRGKDIIPPEGTSTYTAIVHFGNVLETCHTSKMDSLGSQSIASIEREESLEESSASIAPVQDHESPPFMPPNAAKKKKGGKNKKVAQGY